MSDEISLREYVDRRFDDQDKAVQTALTSAEKAVVAALAAAKEAVSKAETANDKRFDSVNEFRAQLADQTANLMPRTEYTVQHKAIEEKLADLINRVNTSDGKSSGFDKSWAMFLAVIGVGLVVIGLVLKK
jgi:hypothetical protein